MPKDANCPHRYEIVVTQVCNTKHPITQDQGEILHRLINIAMKSGWQVIVSFKDVEIMTSRFLMSAFGELFRDKNPVIAMVHDNQGTERASDIIVKDLSQPFRRMLARVLFESKNYYEQLYEEQNGIL